ncbi:PHP domain-containing protein [Psychrosphaera aestuarii]|uniref:PHP domain-containing protein n=1 Tax=Psychrosphaera aestuarii TaxID=1266052 RepID=UPI001B31F2E8|nr:PHP domain-containing protein [Psychrosphaera aestuarii]
MNNVKAVLLKVLVKFVKFSSGSFIILLMGAFLLLQSSSLIEDKAQLSSEELNQAKNAFKTLSEQLSSNSSSFNISLTSIELNSTAKMINHLWPHTVAHIATSEYGMLLSTSSRVNLLGEFYLNTRCIVTNSLTGTVEFDQCYVGSLPVNSWLVKLIMYQSLKVIVGSEFVRTFDIALSNIVFSEAGITTHGEKSRYLKENINASLYKFKEVAKSYSQTSDIDKSLIQLYINELSVINSNQFHDYLMVLFKLAAERSIDNDPVKENSAAIWALGAKFGSHHFSSIWEIEIPRNADKPFPQLRGREDLTKHFVYSAVLQLIGDSSLSFSIGETKELLDSLSGGSGYSFADLAADIAGLQFAEFVTSNERNALSVQGLLSNVDNEDVFFPFVHDFPEGLNEATFKRLLSSKYSGQYLEIRNEISARIDNLKLYNSGLGKDMQSLQETWSEPNQYGLDFYHKVDTHIHTKYSDGGYTVKQIADKAAQFGCEAVAITDHSDLDLKRVLSIEFFEDLKYAQQSHPYLTIIPGLEWNIPPLNGREHVTVLLPESSYLQDNLINFRKQFDHFNRYEAQLLSPITGLNWLNQLSNRENGAKPVLIYNHPNRKDFQTTENAHDFAYWRKHSNLVVGFSGAPGHQKMKNDKNGSYENSLKTINGWDPSVARTGGEWDKLLQKGYKVWAARAASDFHNTDMDYWPCEFSSTHVKSRSNSHNDILTGLRRGNIWAQHGSFVKKLSFTATVQNQVAQIGEEVVAEFGEEVLVELNVNLADLDWQGNEPQLNQVELVIITEDEIKSKTFDLNHKTDKQIKLQHRMTLASDKLIFRWRGTNKQIGQADYLFYTNPIKIKKRL